MITDFKSKQYMSFGKELGKVLEEVLIGNARLALEQSVVSDVARVFEGIILGFGESVSTNFESCINDAENDFKMLLEAVNDIKSLKPEQVKKGL